MSHFYAYRYIVFFYSSQEWFVTESLETEGKSKSEQDDCFTSKEGLIYRKKCFSVIHILIYILETIITADLSNATLLNICRSHWHFYQYRNKIPLKQENTAMLYQLETFTTTILHVQPQNMMPGKI